MSIALASPRTGMLRRVGCGRCRSRAGAAGLDLTGDHADISSLIVDCSCVPGVDSRVGSDLFVTACTWRTSKLNLGF